MVWFKTDDKLHGHIKSRRAGVEAMGLWVLAGSYCADNLTDGFVSADVPTILAGRDGDKLAQKLVDARLWHIVDGGWQFHDWAEYQPTSESVRTRRTEAKQRMESRRSQRVRANTTRTDGEHVANDERTDDEQNELFAVGSRARARVPVPVPVPEENTPLPPAGGGEVVEPTEVPSPVREVWDHWVAAMDSPRSVLDAKRRRLIAAAIKSHGVETCLRAIDGCRGDPWSMGRNERKRPFNSAELIFRDAAHIERFAALASDAQQEPLFVSPALRRFDDEDAA